jgi:hypothetical protein
MTAMLNEIRTRGAVFFVLVFVAAPIQAEMLLAEIGWNQPEPITLPAVFSLRVVDAMTDNQASIGTQLTSPDQTMAMTLIDQNEHPGTIAQFNLVLTRTPNTIRRAYITNDGQPINEFGFNSFDGIWFPDFDPDDGYHAMAHVEPAIDPPYTGLGLFGYWITSVEQVVTPAGQTVYFYGTFIPEPSAASLVSIGLIHFFSVRRRR